jgi:hypothetical protein
MKVLLLTVSTACLVTHHANAQQDSSSDAPGGFGQVVERAAGVMIRVPINERGEELASAAEIRVYEGNGDRGAPTDLKAAWRAAVDGAQAPVVSASTSVDSSTCGWGSHWGSNGWQPVNYFATYRPNFYYNGYNYVYGSPYDHSYYGKEDDLFNGSGYETYGEPINDQVGGQYGGGQYGGGQYGGGQYGGGQYGGGQYGGGQYGGGQYGGGQYGGGQYGGQYNGGNGGQYSGQYAGSRYYYYPRY